MVPLVMDERKIQKHHFYFSFLLDHKGSKSFAYCVLVLYFNTFKQTQSSNTDRVLTIIFGPQSRFIEIRGSTGDSITAKLCMSFFLFVLLYL
jgi:hypothetical protein